MPTTEPKSPFVALVLNLLIPGLGMIYATGRVGRGLWDFVGTTLLFIFWFPAGLFVYLLEAINVYHIVFRRNKLQAQAPPPVPAQVRHPSLSDFQVMPRVVMAAPPVAFK